MRPTNSASRVNIWKSPIPYLFGSLAFVLVLIAMALVLLACSFKKRSSNSPSDHDQEAQEKPPEMLLKVLDPEPKIAVIMAGEDIPTYLATPATASPTCCCEHV